MVGVRVQAHVGAAVGVAKLGDERVEEVVVLAAQLRLFIIVVLVTREEVQGVLAKLLVVVGGVNLVGGEVAR